MIYAVTPTQVQVLYRPVKPYTNTGSSLHQHEALETLSKAQGWKLTEG